MEGADAPAIAAAQPIIEGLTAQPSLLLEAGADLDAWLAAPTADAALAQKVTTLRDQASAGRDAAEAETVSGKQLAAMLVARPWDQHVALQLARAEASHGKLAAALARLAALGPAGLTIRDARLLRGQLLAATGKLAEADEALSSLLGARLDKFVAASTAQRAALAAVQSHIKSLLDSGDIPPALQTKLEHASKEETHALVSAWIDETVDNDATLKAAHAAYVALADVVPVSIAAGSVKLRRAQAMTGAARDAMLQEAERTFLSVKTDGEDQPEFRLGLGEIYARLGKTAASDAELQAVIDRHEPELTFKVASVYRELGSVERATAVATELFATAPSPVKDSAAIMLALLATNEEASEAWYRKADPTDAFVKTSLLELEGTRLLREGKRSECEAKFAAAAKAHLVGANAANRAGYNNAANAYAHRFECNGDLASLREAERIQEIAYRADPDDAIVVANLASLLTREATVRVMAKRLDLHALRVGTSSYGTVLARAARQPGARRDPGRPRRRAQPPARERATRPVRGARPEQRRCYQSRFQLASLRRDVTAAAAIVASARAATQLDTSAAAASRARGISGADDAKTLQELTGEVDLLATVPGSPKVDARTRAAASYLTTVALDRRGLLQRDPEMLARARTAAAEAMTAWSSLDANAYIIGSWIDEAGLAADPVAWIAERRVRSSIASLAKLVADHSPIAAAIRTSSAWHQVAALAHAQQGRPTLDDLRLARLLADADLETRARPALDDQLVRLSLELDAITTPGDPSTAEDLAIMGAR